MRIYLPKQTKHNNYNNNLLFIQIKTLKIRNISQPIFSLLHLQIITLELAAMACDIAFILRNLHFWHNIARYFFCMFCSVNKNNSRQRLGGTVATRKTQKGVSGIIQWLSKEWFDDSFKDICLFRLRINQHFWTNWFKWALYWLTRKDSHFAPPSALYLLATEKYDIVLVLCLHANE